MTRLLFTGGRHYSDAQRVRQVLGRARTRWGAFVAVHGACPTGADKLVNDTALAMGLTVEPHPADWTQGRRAGPDRNSRMVATRPDACIAFPGGRGTLDCASKATQAGITVYRV